MNENSEDYWAQTIPALGFILALLIAVNTWIRASFKSKKEEREAEIIRQERERSETITRAVQTGLESFNKEIRNELKNHRDETDKQFKVVHGRIDEVLLNHKEK